MTIRFHATIEVPRRTTFDHTTKQTVVFQDAATVKVFFEIDELGIANRLGAKAWRNKSKKSSDLSGLVRCIEARRV